MTRLEAVDLIRASAPLFLQCPNCAGTDLWCEELPRGDYPVECLGCGKWHTYAQLERLALAGIRRLLSRDFPALPIERKEEFP